MASDRPPHEGSRVARKQARSRAALIAAAQECLAQGRINVSIQDLTDAADIGFGSFYTHFAGKEQLFDAAMREAIEAHGAEIDAITAGVEDPAEAFAIGVRRSCLRQREVPTLVRAILNSGASVLDRDEGLVPRARADIEGGMATGQFVAGNPQAAVMFVGGALLGAMQLLDQDPSLDADAVASDLAVRLLCLLGLDRRAAEAVVARPLPTPVLTGVS